MKDNVKHAENLGRFPANLLHDGSDEIEKLFPDVGTSERKNMTIVNKNVDQHNINVNYVARNDRTFLRKGGSGSASRFFKEIKNKKELIKYLIVLITPKEGICFNEI